MIISNDELTWYYKYSAGDLGMSGATFEYNPDAPFEQRWPSDRQVRAAGRQRRIRAALRQLSRQLQAVLEAAYEPWPHSVQLVHEHELAAGLVQRIYSAARDGQIPPKLIDPNIKRAKLLLEAAHEAFQIALARRTYTPRARAQAWLAQHA